MFPENIRQINVWIEARLTHFIRIESWANDGLEKIHPTSTIASGVRSAISSKFRAAPDGSRRPCSHSCKVRTDTPSNFANAACDRPTLIRASVAAETATLVTRPSPPRAWRIDSSKSTSNAVTPSFFDLLFFVVVLRLIQLGQLTQKSSRHMLVLCFGINNEKHYVTQGSAWHVNHPCSAALIPERAKRTLRKPPVAAIKSPESECSASHETNSSRSSSLQTLLT